MASRGNTAMKNCCSLAQTDKEFAKTSVAHVTESPPAKMDYEITLRPDDTPTVYFLMFCQRFLSL
jgi:hypothetical protein